MNKEEIKKYLQSLNKQEYMRINYRSNENGYNLLFDDIVKFKPKSVIEIGVGHGHNTLYMLAACLNIGAFLVCVDISKNKLEQTKKTIQDCFGNKVKNVEFILGNSIDVLPDILKRYKVQYCLVDGLHHHLHIEKELRLLLNGMDTKEVFNIIGDDANNPNVLPLVKKYSLRTSKVGSIFYISEEDNICIED